MSSIISKSIIPEVSQRGRNIYYANVPIHGCYPLVRSSLEKFARYDFFYGKDNAVSTSYSYSCAAVFNCFYCVFDLGFSCSAMAMMGSRSIAFKAIEISRQARQNLLGSSFHQGKIRNSKDRSLFLWMSVQAQSACNDFLSRRILTMAAVRYERGRS